MLIETEKQIRDLQKNYFILKTRTLIKEIKKILATLTLITMADNIIMVKTYTTKAKNNNNPVLNLDNGLFDENFPGVIGSNVKDFFGHPYHSLQNNFKLNQNIANLNEPLHNINHHKANQISSNQFPKKQIRFKRNRNRFRGNNQNQFQNEYSDGHGRCQRENI